MELRLMFDEDEIDEMIPEGLVKYDIDPAFHVTEWTVSVYLSSCVDHHLEAIQKLFHQIANIKYACHMALLLETTVDKSS